MGAFAAAPVAGVRAVCCQPALAAATLKPQGARNLARAQSARQSKHCICDGARTRRVPASGSGRLGDRGRSRRSCAPPRPRSRAQRESVLGARGRRHRLHDAPNFLRQTSRARASSVSRRCCRSSGRAPIRAGATPARCGDCRSGRGARARATRRNVRRSGGLAPQAGRAGLRLSTGSSAATRSSLRAQLLAAVLALRQPLQRARLQRQPRCRCVGWAHRFGRDGAGAARTAAPHATLRLARAAAECPSIRAPCSRSRARGRGSRAGTRARCPCPGRSSRRCRRTRSRTSRARRRRRPCR